MDIRVFLVDDSPTVIAILSQMVALVPGAQVVGTAASGDEALELVPKLKPDIVTLDIEMPGKSGLQVLPYLQKSCDAAIIMCSTLTGQAASHTLQSLEKGAFDYIPKTEINKTFTQDIFRERLLVAYNHVLQKRKGESSHYKPTFAPAKLPYFPVKALVIGVSTGGPAALQKLFSHLPILPIPTVIVQHMAAPFVTSLAERLSSQTPHKASVATAGTLFQKGHVYFAPGDAHIFLRRQFGGLYAHISQEPKNLLHKPSADILFQSAAETLGKELLAVVLTGMGKDGAEGAKTVRHRGGFVLAESQSSCIVYGMPKAVIENRTAHYEFPLQEMSQAVSRVVLGNVS